MSDVFILHYLLFQDVSNFKLIKEDEPAGQAPYMAIHISNNDIEDML